MKHPWLSGLAALVVACLSVTLLAGAAGLTGSPILKPAMATAFLKISDDSGHGSGVHIGNGYVLTAAHVVGASKTVTLTDSQKRDMAGEVLWSNRTYDVALVRLPGASYVESASLSCAPNYVRQRVTIQGNPGDMDFMFTSGEVNGASRQWAGWRLITPVDATIIPGQSGGAAIDANGLVVGIAVGVMAYQFGLTGQGVIVPGSVVCELMGRA